jgi:DNA-binding NarL/FixJ family response regulator
VGRVFLVDDHAPVRSALRLLLEHEDGIDVVGETGDPGRVADQVALAHPDLVLLDWELVERAGRELIAAVHKAWGAARVVALSCRPEDSAIAREAGADGFVCMGDPAENMLRTLRAVLAS